MYTVIVRLLIAAYLRENFNAYHASFLQHFWLNRVAVPAVRGEVTSIGLPQHHSRLSFAQAASFRTATKVNPYHFSAELHHRNSETFSFNILN